MPLFGVTHAESNSNHLKESEWEIIKEHEKEIARDRKRKIALRAGAMNSIVRDIRKTYKHKCPCCDHYKSTKEALLRHIKWEHEA